MFERIVTSRWVTQQRLDFHNYLWTPGIELQCIIYRRFLIDTYIYTIIEDRSAFVKGSEWADSRRMKIEIALPQLVAYHLSLYNVFSFPWIILCVFPYRVTRIRLTFVENNIARDTLLGIHLAQVKEGTVEKQRRLANRFQLFLVSCVFSVSFSNDPKGNLKGKRKEKGRIDEFSGETVEPKDLICLRLGS